MRSFALLAFAAAATAQQNCGNGEWVNDCCLCNPGWTTPASASENDEMCTVCERGFVMSEDGKQCSSGRKGAATCTDGGEYPYFGCTYQGTQIGTCAAGDNFPCDCSAYGTCEKAVSELTKDQCYPRGARIYSTFPNQPIVSKPFSLTVLGCRLEATDRLVVMPAWNEDLTAETSCSQLSTNNTAGISESCQFETDAAAVLGGGAGNACNGTQLLLKKLKAMNVKDSGLTQVTYKGLIIEDGAFRGTANERATANREAMMADNANPVTERETYFRVCMLTQVPRQIGARDGYESMWVEVAGHDHIVKKRDYMFKVSKEQLYDPNAAADLGAADEGEGCCDGLKVGSLCLDLWIFLLLWLLMACCLGAMGYTLNKNQNEIEAQKNNERYEQFNVDDEMSAMAAKQAEDEDDDI